MNLQAKQGPSDLLCPDIQVSAVGSSKPTCTSDFASLASSGVAITDNATKSTLEDTRFWVMSSDAGPQRQLPICWPHPASSAACVQGPQHQKWTSCMCFAHAQREANSCSVAQVH